MRTRPPALESYPFQTAHDLRYADMDANSHVNNGAFGSLMETSRSLMFTALRKAAQTPEEQTGTATVIARFEIDYLREMHWPGSVVATTGIEKVGGASFVLRQAVFVDGHCAGVARSTCLFLDSATRKAVPLTPRMRAEFERWMMRGE